jgi:hypothetical protein
MLLVIVTVRFFDYDYAHKHDRENPGAKEVRKNRNSPTSGHSLNFNHSTQ